MDRLFTDIKGQALVYYMDDILVIGKTFEEHLNNLELVFSRLRLAKLKLQRRKCHFAQREVKFLGFLIKEGTVSPDPEELRAITLMPKPDTIEKLQSYLGKIAYYRQFTKNHATHAQPLYRMIKEKKIDWTEESTRSFEFFQQKLVTPPILIRFDPLLEVTLMTDASSYGIGCCVTQRKDGKERNIAYFSRQLNDRERKYSVSKCECLAIIFGIKKARPYIYGNHFTVLTDHSALSWLLTMKNPNNRLFRWLLYLSDYNFTVIHRKGKFHANCDSLSRNPLPETIRIEQDSDLHDSLIFNIIVSEAAVDLDQLIKLQSADDFCKFLSSLPPENLVERGFFVDEGLIKKRIITDNAIKKLIVLPLQLIDSIQAVARTLSKINQTFYHPSLMKLVKRKVRSCHSCKINKPRNKQMYGIPEKIPTEHIPFNAIAIDLMGPIPTSLQGNNYIISAIDIATRYLVSGGIPNKRTTPIAEFLINKVYYIYSFPQIIISDKGKEFCNQLLDRIHDTLGIAHHRSSSYNPRANSVIERNNRTVGDSLRHYLSIYENEWENMLHAIVFTINTSINESSGYTPFFLLFSREHTSLTDYMFKASKDTRVVD